MNRSDNSLNIKHTPFRVAVFALLLIFGSTSLFEGANAAQKSAQHKDSEVHWGYEPDNGPASWGKLNKDWRICAEGDQQSPIDLTGARQKSLDKMKLDFPAANLKIVRQTHVLEALDNGHTIQINYDSGETLEIGGESFALRQYHFHSPSEHTVNGRRFPMEMHLVHLSQDKKIAVIGIFIEQGRHNEAFDRIWSNLPTRTGQEVIIENVQVDIDRLLPKSRATYRYSGSLTTPPCSQRVGWFVYAEPIEMSREQIKAFRKVFHGNNRPIQPMNNRLLWYDGIKTITN